jgi:hypothetical protein
MTFLERVGDTSAAFERRLWGHVRNFMALGREQPGLLVDCARCVELQEQVGKRKIWGGMGFGRPGHVPRPFACRWPMVVSRIDNTNGTVMHVDGG